MRPYVRVLALLLVLFPGAVWAACVPVAERGRTPLLQRASFTPPPLGEVRIEFLGHASFAIESAGGASIVTDYSGAYRPAYVPDIVTMNNSHSTHWTPNPDPGIVHVLQGWGDVEGQPAQHDVRFKDVRVRNVPTNARDWGGGTRVNGNSIFVYEVANLCIAHLGHLHHVLTETHLALLGLVDVLMLPVDGAFTMGQPLMEQVIEQIKPSLILPMHYFTPHTLNRFLDRMRPTHQVIIQDRADIVVSRATLPRRPQIVVLPGF